ncbi:GntR family transcriptional regulator [Shouchella clausii]|uniref:MocR-like pyridoxine biosynthesis transcription factor PdxR n=1 Tax=Shouchella clausii TaxID=79880 RepID=UPI001B07AEA0|nr:PLP-dependent aminotransferase family protein [Shouchella clausii]MDO7266933.1 PLP-dependent aminotransferase family protein [Shouchella clausii]MDO7286152.1 PLP-dependent aminotransferase family protein [Shouchella clausii]GIN07743.1 GntR family transcriptional regulator [Shouchella clausii]
MKIEINRHSDIPIAQQIQENIADRIRSNLLEEGSKLPSVRKLAEQTGVSLMTANKAYNHLEKQGLIEKVQGLGTYVRKNSRTSKTENEKKLLSYDWQLTVTDYLPRAQYMQFNTGKEKIQFSSSKIWPNLLPNRYLIKETIQILSEEPYILSTYGEGRGDITLRKEMSAYLKHLKIAIEPDDIVITNGVQQGIDIVARSFVGPGDVVVTETPTYSAAIDVFRGRGASIVSIPVDENGMRVDLLPSLKNKPKVIYTIPSFQNPTGTLLSKKRRQLLLDFAQSNEIIIIEDDSWSEIYFDSKPPLPIKSLDEYGHVIYLKGLSKTLSPGCRIGVMATSGTNLNRIIAAKTITDLGTPLLNQKAVLSFLRSNRMKEHIKKLRIALKLRRDRVIDLLTVYAPKEVTWIVPKGGVNIWISLPPWVDTNQMLFEAKKFGISFLPGSACYPKEPAMNHLRLCFAAVDDQLLETGIKTLCKIFTAFIEERNEESNMPLV